MVSSQWLRVESIHLMLDATGSRMGGQEVKIRKSGMTFEKGKPVFILDAPAGCSKRVFNQATMRKESK
jgi:hypothetical protein